MPYGLGENLVLLLQKLMHLCLRRSFKVNFSRPYRQTLSLKFENVKHHCGRGQANQKAISAAVI